MDRLKTALDIVVKASKLGDYDSNVIGLAAEIIAEEAFRMRKAPRGTRDVDGHWYKDGRNQTVQVKGWSENRILTYRRSTYFRLRENALPDVLLCLLVRSSKPGYEVLYNGCPKAVGRVEKDGTHRVIHFRDLKCTNEVLQILEDTAIKSRLKKRCSICGEVKAIKQFTYDKRNTNSYCIECRKAVAAEYSRGGAKAAQLFRQSMRSRWQR